MGRDMMRIPRPMGSRFSEIPRAEIARSQFDLSHGLKTTFDAGYLIPIFVEEALPGDTLNVKLQAFARLATPLKPVMDNMYLDTFFFSVPNRLLWNHWEHFNGAQEEPGDSTDFNVPSVGGGAGLVTSGSLADYMGLPLGLNPGNVTVSALPFRAYARIWYDWFRDENLQGEPHGLPLAYGDGPDNEAARFATLLRRGKRHDYFTSALPWPQKGAAVSLPLGTSAPVTYPGTVLVDDVAVMHSSSPVTGVPLVVNAGAAGQTRVYAANVTAVAGKMLYADLAAATAASINQIRQAFQVQKLLERDARGGTRYVEILNAHFGVTSPDARLQRSEYLGGGSSPIFISPIAQTSASGGVTPQGNLSAIGTASFGGHGFTKSFTEHCTIIGLVCARADLTYQQGVERMWSRRTRYDFFWPALAQIGEQAVLNKEIFVSNNATVDTGVFGYQERYAEYRYKPSRLSGLFRSDAAGSLDMWHLAQDFATLPALNAAFIQEDPPVDRVIAVPAEPHFLLDCYFRYKAARPLPVYGVPGMIDHF